LGVCLENKDNENEKYNIERTIQQYNKNIDKNITCICNYLIDYLNDNTIVDSNELYYIDL
jgi:hypothetical protein